jgi:hypothetical protein
MHLILVLLALWFAFAFLRLVFWVVLWLALQPVRAGLGLLVWAFDQGACPPRDQWITRRTETDHYNHNNGL